LITLTYSDYVAAHPLWRYSIALPEEYKAKYLKLVAAGRIPQRILGVKAREYILTYLEREWHEYIAKRTGKEGMPLVSYTHSIPESQTQEKSSEAEPVFSGEVVG
jgi:hypothetical protein